MASPMTSKPPSTKEDSTLEGNIAKPSSTYESSIKKRDSTYSEKAQEPGEPSSTSSKALEEATPKYDESKILHGRRLFFAFVAMLLSVLLIALDQTIIAPALPVIASRFDALDQISWIASSYFLTQTAFLLVYGTFLTIFDRKYVYMASVTWFEIGSLFCAVAPSVNFLIFGRAVAGIGGAGIFVSVLSIIGEITRLEDRPKLFGSFSAVFGFSSVRGPLLGGACTDHVTWRWCFYINLPVGALSVITIWFIVPSTGRPEISPERIESIEAKFRRYTRGKWIPSPESLAFRLGMMDYVGGTLLLGMITCLLLAIQWGGDQFPWKSSIVIGLLCGFAAIAIVFVIWEWKFTDGHGILPLRFFKNRTQVGTCISACFIFFSMLGAIYYLPLLFQAVKHHSATRSGIDILPFMLAIVIGSGVSGLTVSLFGNYWNFLVFGPWLASVGAGLLYTLHEHSSNGKYIGYQIIFGLGVGMVMQIPVVAIQANVDPEDLPQTTALVSFAQLFGGVLGIGVCGTVFANELSAGLMKYAPEAPFGLVRHSVEAIYTLPVEQQAGVIHAYVLAIDKVFLVAVACGALGSLGATLIRNINIKGRAMGGAAA